MSNSARIAAIALLAWSIAGCGGSGGGTGAIAVVTPSPAATASPTPGATPTPTATAAALSVVQGVRVDTETRDATSDVFASADSATQIFDRWTGDVALLLAPNERQSAARAPMAAATVTAVFRGRPTYSYTSFTVKGSPGSPAAVTARYYFPRARPAAGVVFRFHGSGGSARGVTSGTADETFNRDLIADGYAVVALDSDDRSAGQWANVTADPAANPDTVNVRSVIATLTGLGLVDAQTRYFAVGHSNGGAFAPLVAQQLGWRAAWVSCARGNQAMLQRVTTVPTIWTIAQNDSTVGADGNAGALANYQILAGRGIRAAFITFMPSAIYPTRLAMIEGLSVADAQTIQASLRTNLPLDSHDFQVAAPTTTSVGRSVPGAYAAYTKEITDTLLIGYTEHQFSAAASGRVRAFFAAS